MKVVFRLGKTVPLTENMDVGEPLYDADAAALGINAGEQNPRYYPGVRLDGSLKLNGPKLIFPYSDLSYLEFASSGLKITYNGSSVFDINNQTCNIKTSLNINGKTTFNNDISSQGMSITGNITTFSGPVQFLGGINLSLAQFASNILPTPFNNGDILVAGTPHTWKAPSFVLSTLGVGKQIADVTSKDNLSLNFEERRMFVKSPTAATCLSSTSLDTLITAAAFNFSRATTAYFWNKYGVLTQAAINKSRIDHDPSTGECLGLLIEGPSQNILTSTTGETWSINGISRTVGITRTSWTAIGLDNPTQIVETTDNTTHNLNNSISAQNLTQVKTFSTFIEIDPAAVNKTILLQVYDASGSNIFGNYFNLSTKTVGNSNIVGNGVLLFAQLKQITDKIFRISISGIVNPTGSTNANINVNILEARDSDGQVTFTGTGATLWYIGNMVFENYYKVTSYMPASTTRAAENFNINGALFDINDTVGSLKINFSSNYMRVGTPIAVLDSNTQNNNIVVQSDSANNQSIAFNVNALGVNTVNSIVASAFVQNQSTELLFEYKPNSMSRTTVNGNPVTIKAAFAYPASLNLLRIGSTVNQDKFLDGWISAISYVDKIFRYKAVGGITNITNVYNTTGGGTGGTTSGNTDGGQF